MDQENDYKSNERIENLQPPTEEFKQETLNSIRKRNPIVDDDETEPASMVQSSLQFEINSNQISEPVIPNIQSAQHCESAQTLESNETFIKPNLEKKKRNPFVKNQAETKETKPITSANAFAAIDTVPKPKKELDLKKRKQANIKEMFKKVSLY
jgi:hypothetical protein